MSQDKNIQKNDQEEDKLNYEEYNLPYLQNLCKQRGIAGSKDRQRLIDRLKVNDKIKESDFIQITISDLDHLEEECLKDDNVQYFFLNHPQLKIPLQSWSVAHRSQIVSFLTLYANLLLLIYFHGSFKRG